ncbi:MAG: F0F1 ATP synthase subunit gamma [Candidatus Daviesbacteria bacterium]|nr:F0F1 ATP synthase subunit gamma [Candidatus Daviesbacteria bacterium]
MTTRQLTATIDQGLSLKLISQAYTEIASAKLKKIRDQVEKDRFFLEDLAKVYQVVKQVASERQALPQKNNKTISIVITSNYHFYGNVNSNIIKFFVESMNATPCEQIVIGKTALEYLQGVKYPQKYEPVVLKTDYPNLAELNQLVARVKNYSQILIYFAKLKTVMVQEPTFSDITQNSYLKDTPPPVAKGREEIFIFEPELGKILDFFDSQVTNLLLQQTFLESELSRTAARLISMDSAQSNADKFITEQKIQLATVKRSIANSRLLETYTALHSLEIQDET